MKFSNFTLLVLALAVLAAVALIALAPALTAGS
jgi:hypothetical protein